MIIDQSRRELEHIVSEILGLGISKPRFSSSWDDTNQLIQAMISFGYSGFELTHYYNWNAKFSCSLGPCTRHKTKTDNYHGGDSQYLVNFGLSSYSSPILESPQLAILLAASVALSSGELNNHQILVDAIKKFVKSLKYR